MKKSIIILIVLAVVVFLLYSFFKGNYNTMVSNGEAVTSQWADVENVYQRRADLIPNLVNTVKGFAAQEQEVLVGVVEARAKATSVNVKRKEIAICGANTATMTISGSAFMTNLSKSNQNFLELQAQLEGTENRIAVERMKFNEVTRVYNTHIKTFPQTMIANMFGFEAKPYFEAVQGADVAPNVEF